MDERQLVREAYIAQKNAYTPYSHWQVGAALLTKDGRIYHGCNIENAGYSATNCAERTAIFKAVSEGVMEFEAIAIVGNTEGATLEETDYCGPCGVCRQVMREFCEPKTFKIILGRHGDEYTTYTLEELLPLGFGPENLLNR